ncbi:MAG TPA: 50S ribosomal protein L9 [Rhodospirillales bacterium]
MEVILLERIEQLGQMGDVVKVRAGYARNFLLPQKKALRATDENKRRFETQRAQLEADNLTRRQEAEGVATKLDGLQVIIVRQAGDAGQLYGSVSARDIADAVSAAGFTITRQQVGLQNPIKALGLYDVRVALHPEVTVKVTTNVARSEDEAKVQAKTGKAVIAGEPEAAQEAKPKDAEEAAREAAEAQAAQIFDEGVQLAKGKEAEAAAGGAAAEAEATDEKPKKKSKK